MRYCVLGRTGLRVSVVGLGAGPVPALMTGDDPDAQRAVLARALQVGVNWIDTAAGYGEGRSETNLGRALRDLGVAGSVQVATKVRLTPDDLADPLAAVRRSVAASLGRLGLARVTLLQLHNGVTMRRGEIAASLSSAEVLGGVVAALEQIRADGLTQFIGLTGTGTPEALTEVLDSGAFDTVQIPHHVLAPADAGVLACCASRGVGVFAIRVFAGGALLGRPPAAHTRTTPYFPLALYEEDRRRASALAAHLGAEASLADLALRYALSATGPHAALVGLATPHEVDEANASAERGPLEPHLVDRLDSLR